MGNPDSGSDRRMAARSRYRRFWPSAVSGPGIRVIELHVLGMQAQLLSINMGHWRVDRSITVDTRDGFVRRYGQQAFIKNIQLLLLLLEVLKCLRRTMQRRVVASSIVTRLKSHTAAATS
jgi:hypothetical protein